MRHTIKNAISAAVSILLIASSVLTGATFAQAAAAVKYAPTSIATNTTGTQIQITYAVNLATSYIPASTEFTVTVAGVTRATTTYTPSIVGNQIILTLNSPAIAHAQAATVAYNHSGNNKIYRLGQTTDYVNDFAASAVTNNVPAPDTTPPSLLSLSANTAGTIITMAYNEPLLATSVPAASDFVITSNGSTLPNTGYTVSVSGSSVLLTFSSQAIFNNDSVYLQYTRGTNPIKDLAGNLAAAIAHDNVSNPVPDTTAPRVNSRSTNTAGTVVTIYFNEPLSTTNVPAASDFTLYVNTVAYPTANISVDVVDSVVNLHLTGAPIAFGDNLLLTYTLNTDPAKRIQDLAHNQGNATSNQPVNNNVPDLGAPILSGQATNAAGTQIILTYSQPLSTDSVPDPSTYSLKVAGSTYSAFTTSISGSTVVLSLTGAAITHGQSISISYSGTAVKRASNGISAATFSNDVVDNLVPAPAAPYYLNGDVSVDGRSINIYMSKPLNESSIPLASDFAVHYNSVPYAGTYTVSISGSTITLHLSTTVEYQAYVEVAYTPGLAENRIKDLAGNEALAWIDLDATNLVPDNVPPTVVGRVTSTTGDKIIITFSEQLCETCLPDTSDLTLLFDGTRYDPANYTMAIVGATYTFTLIGPPITYGQTIRLYYAPSATIAKRVQDLYGNQLPPTNNAVITNMVSSSGAPAVTSKSTNTTGTVVTVVYDRALDATSVPAATDFVLKVGGVTYPSADYTVSIAGSSVLLTLSGAAISAGASVTLSYTGTEIKAETGGALAPTFTDNVVSSSVHPGLVTLDTDNTSGRNIFLTYNVPLNTSAIPAASDFVLRVNGLIYSSSNYVVAVTGSSVTLDLQLTGPAIKQTDLVTLAYTAGATPIQDTLGNAAPNLAQTVVSNRVPDTTKPENVSLVTDLIGSRITWVYNEPLDIHRVPLATDLVIYVDGVAYPNTAYTVSVSDSKMVIQLTGERIRFGQIVYMAYTPGLPANQLADPAGNVVDSEPHASILNQVSSSAVPTITSMATNAAGTQVILTYSKLLDASSVPAASDFTLTINDAVYANTSYAVSVTGSTVVLLLSGVAIANGDRVDLIYRAGSNRIKDLAGDYADAFAKSRVANSVPDTTPPSIVSRVTNTDGTQIIITLNEALDPAFVPLSSDVTLMFDGVRYAPSNYTVSVIDSQVIYTLTGPAIRYGQVLRISYTPNPTDDSKHLRDLSGNQFGSSSDQSIENRVPDTAAPSVVSANTNILGDSIAIGFNYALNTGSVPPASAFLVHVGGSVYASSNYTVSISGSTVTLHLTGAAIAHDAAVTVTYSGTSIKRASNSIAAANFANLTIVNNVPDTTAPVILLREEITIYVGSTAVTTATADDTVTWTEELDEAHLFSIDHNTGVITASPSAPVGVYSYTVTATNDGGIQSDATITIMVRPLPIVASNGGESSNAAPLPPVATLTAPVSGVTTAVAETKVVASIQTSLGLRTVSVLEPVGGVPVGATISIKPGPVSDESMDGRFTIEVKVTGPTGQDITAFDKVFTINMGQYLGGFVPAHSADGKTWPALPMLAGDWLPAGGHDGYYVDASGNLIILTHHMTFYGIKKDQQRVHDLRILTGPTRVVTGGEFQYLIQGGLGAGVVSTSSLTPELCSIQADNTVHALHAGTCVIQTVKTGDGVYADAVSEQTELLIEDPSATMRVYGSIKLLRVDLGTVYAGKTVSILMSTPADHPFKLYRKVTLDDAGVKEIRAAFDSHATFKVLYGDKVIVNAVANH